jgi:hypothetical protein
MESATRIGGGRHRSDGAPEEKASERFRFIRRARANDRWVDRHIAGHGHGPVWADRCGGDLARWQEPQFTRSFVWGCVVVRRYAPRGAESERLETEARAARRGVWAEDRRW